MNAYALLLAGLLLSPSVRAHSEHRWDRDARAYGSYREAGVPAANALHRANAAAFAPLEKIDGAYLAESLRVLAGEKDPVLANRKAAPGRAAARAFLRREFAALGYAVRDEAYASGVNFVAEKPGRSGKFLIVSAHYDSVGNSGADDDATGTATLLAAAKLLGDRALENGVRFVAFDEEELGLVGSKAYVKALDAAARAALIGDLQIEMLGYNAKKDGRFHVITCDRAESRFFADAFAAAVADADTGVRITDACTDRSDHASFWNAGIPAVVISQNFFGGDSNPCYHRACDTVEGVDFAYFQNVAEVAANVVVRIATAAAPTPPTRTEPPRSDGSRWPNKSAR